MMRYALENSFALVSYLIYTSWKKRPKLKERIGIDFILEEQICYFSKQEHLSLLPTPSC